MGDMDPQCDPLSIPKLASLAEDGFKVYPNPSTGNITIICISIPKESITFFYVVSIVDQATTHYSYGNDEVGIGLFHKLPRFGRCLCS